jgi:hypothetical protein
MGHITVILPLTFNHMGKSNSVVYAEAVGPVSELKIHFNANHILIVIAARHIRRYWNVLHCVTK